MSPEGWAAIIAAVIIAGPTWIKLVRDWPRNTDDED